MKKNIFSKTISSLLLVGLLLVATPQPVVAQTQSWQGVCVSSTISGAEDVATVQGLQCLIANVLSVATTIIGFGGFIMLIVASFRYLISGGTSKGTEMARNSITYAVIGLVIALSAFIIINLIAQFTGVSTILQFVIPPSSYIWE